MRRAICLLMTVFSLVAWTTPTEAGLFGPSKRELMQRMLDQQRDSHQTQILMYGEMKTQTELLRQIAGQNAQAAARLDRLPDDISQHLIPASIRAIPKGQPTIPQDIDTIPEATVPTFPGSIRGIQQDQPTIRGPILESRNSQGFATHRRGIKVLARPVIYVNQNVRR